MSIDKKYKRIISLVPSQTELLIDLGLEENIVGVTKFCIHPKHLLKTKTIVGGTKNIKIDRIKNLQPDIILCNKEENTKEIVEACQQIAFTHVSDIFTLTDSLELISLYGSFFEKQVEAKKMINKLESKIIDFKKFIENKKSRKVAYFIWRNPWMVAASNTFINHLLELNKFDNVYANAKRYPEVNIKDILKKKPELILLSSEPFPFKEKHITEIKEHTSNSTPILVDGEYFSWYGSRLLKAFDYFKELHSRT
ncbi:cobalamin-binding protein [Tenacibaculum discolor]|uniref:Cobalamin-binding protein n=1 Tax=Tenacibaculum discolor TaxID=361581 RepID=A0A2G1BSZ7_9FLAO|nr:helical backbone metal receptor [Tenacibaculum discolor]MDP2542460.1 helical backbone metal receptor [Tenacibaculum discolor]PHN97157.1 cobalamin-binding protein [Tenacibaculum discolor]PHO00712.1 cobalamin-binding protein [Rhodobacteraceae bacterium 4F10]